MLVLKVLALSLGLKYAASGYLIHFKKKYSLVKGFEEEFRAGCKKESYANRIGLMEFVVGIAISLAAIALIIFNN